MPFKTMSSARDSKLNDCTKVLELPPLVIENQYTFTLNDILPVGNADERDGMTTCFKQSSRLKTERATRMLVNVDNDSWRCCEPT